MNCLITGGAGFIGIHLTRQLSARFPGQVRVLDNFTRAEALCASAQRAFALVPGDIRDPVQLRNAMAGCQVVFHLAAIATVMECEQHPADTLSVNVNGTYEVLQAARELGVARVIFASSREVYGEPALLPVTEDSAPMPKNAYGASKAAAEMYCSWFASTGMEVTALRLTNVYGPGDTGRVIPKFIASARAGTALTLYGGNQIVDFVWIDRVVDAFVAAGCGPYVRGSVNVGSGVGVTILRTANRVLAACGTHSQVNVVPSRQIEVSRFVADVSRAKLELGLQCSEDPLADLAQFVPGPPP
jgi:UDP-glucose 4-epimerase